MENALMTQPSKSELVHVRSKNIHGMLPAFAADAQAAPKNHAKLLQNADYKSSYERYGKTMAEAKERLAAHEYAKLAADFEEEIARAAAASIKAGSCGAEAYATEYAAAAERMHKELGFDWLRKHAVGIQGFYRLKSAAYDGYLTVQEGDASKWAVYIYAGQKRAPHNNGELRGEGRLEGGKLVVNYGNDNASATVTLVFEGETARVETSKAFKESGWFGATRIAAP